MEIAYATVNTGQPDRVPLELALCLETDRKRIPSQIQSRFSSASTIPFAGPRFSGIGVVDPRRDDGLQAEEMDCRVEAWSTVQRSRAPTWTAAPVARYSTEHARSESIGWEIRELGGRLVLNKVAPSRVPCRMAQYQLARARCFRPWSLGAARNLDADSRRNWHPPARQHRHRAQSTIPPQSPRGIAVRQRLRIVESET